jgi:hypothetical protein
MGSGTAGLNSDWGFMDWMVVYSCACGKPKIQFHVLGLGLGTISGWETLLSG